jgi:GNAT superfamily N-acetyltransferase
MLVAEEDGRIVGLTACGESRDPDAGPAVGEIWTFFVAAGLWRRGVGRALMEAALAELRRRGYAEVTVWSFAANERANGFYAARGFVPDGAKRTEETWADIGQIRFRRALA